MNKILTCVAMKVPLNEINNLNWLCQKLKAKLISKQKKKFRTDQQNFTTTPFKILTSVYDQPNFCWKQKLSDAMYITSYPVILGYRVVNKLNYMRATQVRFDNFPTHLDSFRLKKLSAFNILGFTADI